MNEVIDISIFVFIAGISTMTWSLWGFLLGNDVMESLQSSKRRRKNRKELMTWKAASESLKAKARKQISSINVWSFVPVACICIGFVAYMELKLHVFPSMFEESQHTAAMFYKNAMKYCFFGGIFIGGWRNRKGDKDIKLAKLNVLQRK